ncbi:hypothetical protein ACB092_04G181100 [Castanea dentata]
MQFSYLMKLHLMFIPLLNTKWWTGSYDLSEKVLNLLNFLELTGASNFLRNNLIYFFFL